MPKTHTVKLNVTVFDDRVWCERCLTSAAVKLVVWRWDNDLGPRVFGRMTFCGRCDA